MSLQDRRAKYGSFQANEGSIDQYDFTQTPEGENENLLNLKKMNSVQIKKNGYHEVVSKNG